MVKRRKMGEWAGFTIVLTRPLQSVSSIEFDQLKSVNGTQGFPNTGVTAWALITGISETSSQLKALVANIIVLNDVLTSLSLLPFQARQFIAFHIPNQCASTKSSQLNVQLQK